MSAKPPLPGDHVSLQMFLRLLTLGLLGIHDFLTGFSWFSLGLGLVVALGAWIEWYDEVVSEEWHRHQRQVGQQPKKPGQ